MEKLLEIKNLVVGYGSRTLLSEASFDMERSTMTALIGRNGTGKTTLLKTIAGLLRPKSGEIIIEGMNLRELSPSTIAKNISIVLTQKISLQGVNVKTLVEMGRFPSLGRFHFSNKDDDGIVESCMEKLQIAHLAEKRLAQISDGELQKAMIARALAQQSALIIMDEPTAFLDYIAKEELFVTLKNLVATENISILFSSHDLELVKKYADRTLKVEEGKLAEIIL